MFINQCKQELNPGKLATATATKSLQSCATLCYPIDGSLPGSPVPGILQAPPSLGFSRQEHWSGLPFPSPMHESEKWKWSYSVVSDCSRPHRLQSTRLCRPWDFPGKSTGVGCHRLLHLGSLSIHKCENICNLIHVSIFIFSEQDNLWPNLKKEKASLVAQMVKNLPEIQEIWVWSLGWEDALEKELATYSSNLVWRTPWTEEHGGLQPMGSERIWHNWVTKTFFHVSLSRKKIINIW